MQSILKKQLAGAVLFAFAAIPAAHAEIDFNTLESPSGIAALSGEAPSETPQAANAVEAGDDGGPGGAIFNPFSRPAASPAQAPAPAAVARPSAAPQPEPTMSLTLITVVVGVVLAALLLRRLAMPDRRSA